MGTEWFLVLLGLTVVNSHISHVKVSQNGLFAAADIPDLKDICRNLVTSIDDVSETCAEQLNVVCGNLTLLATMLDASSKFPYAGLGYASKMDYGNFDQCMTIDHRYEGGRILGKHCTVGLLIPDIFDNISDPSTYYRLSTCRPDACYAKDYNAIAKNVTNGTLPELFQDIMCQTAESNTDFTTIDIITMAIFAVILVLMAASTLYDIFIYQFQLKSAHPLLTAFSVLSNGRKLLHISAHSKSKEQIEIFHGLRVISMMWIVAGHGFVGWQSIAVTNRDVVNNWLKQRYAGYISTSPLAVDTFFYMSGFLLAFQYFKGKRKPLINQVLSIPHMYLHRYLRLTPAMLMVYLTVISIFQHWGDGPIWPYTDNLAQSCKDHWWSFFLYIQNYYNYDDICITQTWYLSADMQMFIISPLVLIPLSVALKHRSGFKISMAELLTLNIFWTFLPMVLKLCFRDYTNDYDTHSRLINYFIGMMLGVFMREKIDQPFLYGIKENRKYTVNLAAWGVILLGMLTTIICYQEVEMNHGYESKSVFYSLMRPAWCIGLSWITYSCYHGYGGFVNWILCRPIYQVLGRLTYCIYLLHGSVIVYYILTTRAPWFFTDYNAFYLFCGHYLVSIILAIFWTLAFESPLIIIEKLLLGGSRRPQEILAKPTPKQDVEEGPTKDVNQNGSSGEFPTDGVEVRGAYKRNNEVY